MTAGLLVLLAGCIREKKEEGAGNIHRQDELGRRQEEMERYLKKKYGKIPYEVTGIIWRFWNQQYDQMNIQTEWEGREEACWVRRYEREENVFFTDNYFGISIRREYEHKMEEQAERFFPNVKVISFMQDTEFSEAVDRDDNLEKARKKGEEIRVISWMFTAGVGRKTFESTVSKFADLWEEEEMESLVSVFLMENAAQIPHDREQAEKIVREHLYQEQKVRYIEGKKNR